MDVDVDVGLQPGRDMQKIMDRGSYYDLLLCDERNASYLLVNQRTRQVSKQSSRKASQLQVRSWGRQSVSQTQTQRKGTRG